ncbi:MAG: hypothetical protein Q7O66_11560 [Dehalococcoidia bacterium]|nr:hypothetical protein [Dehalococcoidia bacterium]
MSRIDELQKKYPSIPRDMIICWDAHRNGIRYTEVIDTLSYYDRGRLYQSRDTDVTLKDIAMARPRAIREGLVLNPTPMYTKSGFGAQIVRDTQSSYEIREEGPEQYALYAGEEKVEDVYFPKPKKRWGDYGEKEPRTSKGTPVTSLVNLRRRCFMICELRHCQYFDTGDQCKFCNFNASQEDASSIGVSRPVTINLDETVEAYKIITSEMPPLIEGRLTMGGLADSEQEAKIHLQFVEKLASTTSYLPNIGSSTQPMSRANLQRLKDAGLGSISMNIEVWHPQLFEEVCPGKAKNRGRGRYLEAYQDAVEILGWGSVGTNMPPGLTLIPENGHKTWREAWDSQAEGVRWLIQRGVLPSFGVSVLGEGSVFGANPANRAKLPPTEYHLELILAHHQACKEFDMYSRMNKLLWCPLDCPPNQYAGELGMIEIAGDLGKWADMAVPADANWLGRFIESFKSPALTDKEDKR